MQPAELDASLRRILHIPDLDLRVAREPELAMPLFAQLAELSEVAWNERSHEDDPTLTTARLITTRALYRLYRLRFYWGDDPSLYENESSLTLARLLSQLEWPWQRWLAARVPREGLDDSDAAGVLRTFARRDLTPSDSADARWLAEDMNRAGYRRLLEIASLHGLVEASPLSRAVAGAFGSVQVTLFRILMEEYGAGRAEKKHSAFFARMLQGEGLSPTPEAYFASVPWEVLSAINHAFYLTEYKRNYLRFCGAFTYTELSTPVSFRGYAAAAKRLGLSDGQRDYWSLHIREDERHGAWMVEEVALPLLERFPAHRREVLFGYAQQRLVEKLAGAATVRACRVAAHDVESP